MIRYQQGLTLVELLVGFAIIGILVAIGLPSFNNMLTNSQVQRVTEAFHAGLMQAKSEAIRRNTPIQFVPNGNAWTIVVPAVGLVPAEVIGQRDMNQSEGQIVSAVNAANISFSSRGRINLAGGFRVDISQPALGACQAAGGPVRCLRINVSPAGHIRMCDPALPAGQSRSC